MTEGEPVAYIDFAGGPTRPVYEDARSQYVFDDDGNRVDGVLTFHRRGSRRAFLSSI